MCSLMEQRKYWMWSRRKFADKAHLGSFCHKIATTNSYNDLREEQDAASNLGDYIWPPRSYSCSFCRREFRSAQALGGHMNVHRRDRARLKQSPNLTSEGLENNHHNQIACTPLERQFPNQVGSLVCRPLSNPNCLAVASMHEHSDNPCAIPLTDPRTNHRVGMMDLNLGREKLKLREVGYNIPRCWSDGDVAVTSCKRQHTDPMFPFYMKSSSDQHQQQQSEVLKLGTKPVEELDLELRLGGHPNI